MSLRISSTFVQRVLDAKDSDDLIPLVAEAVKVEHMTIPPYLCASYTLLPANRTIAGIIRSVWTEEMLHMTLAANLLNALGGAPNFTGSDSLPGYPDDLPFGIASHLPIYLRKFSIEQVRDTFMAIESPVDPVIIQAAHADRLDAAFLANPEFSTIGLFYMYLSKQIGMLGDSIFKGDKKKQVDASAWFPLHKAEDFVIHDVASAQKAIQIIVDQGEGGPKKVFDDDGSPAHYYRFEQIVRGKPIVPPDKFDQDPKKAITFTADGVVNMDDDPSLSKYDPQSPSGIAAAAFSDSYFTLLKSLETTFNGSPENISTDVENAMGDLAGAARDTLKVPAVYAMGVAPAGTVTGLCFDRRQN